MKKVVVLTGPTGVGKTETAISIAKHFNTDIINGDAFQIYDKLFISTAAPTEDEKKEVKHLLFNFLDPLSEFSIYDYQKLVRSKIEEQSLNNKLPFIVGGSGLYINSVVYDYQFSDTKRSDDFKEKYSSLTNKELHELLKDKDLDAYNKIHPNNRKRVERALELVELNQDINDKNEKVKYYDALIIFLNMDRDLLYTRINNRVDKMVELGLLDEFENVYPKKLGVQASRAIGIQELIEYKLGNNTLDEAINLIKQHSRNYAKRQITWFKHKSDCVMIDKNENSIGDIINLIEKFLNN